VSYYLAPMRLEDIAEVSRVERQCFSNPWPQSAYRRELRNLSNNYYVVLWYRPDNPNEATRQEPRGGLSNLLPFVRRNEQRSTDQVVGFGGMWVLYDEAHVTTIGVAPTHRGRGLGELLLVDLFERAWERKAEWLTLEVRVSNDSAQALYHKYGFSRQGVRRRYYSDNGEDAYIMWSPSLHSAEFEQRFAELRVAIQQRLDGAILHDDESSTSFESASSQGAQ
jgi:[ribosomal protein S18]-alanine N-acetyltransferase